jgi:hypothetical protein
MPRGYRYLNSKWCNFLFMEYRSYNGQYIAKPGQYNFLYCNGNDQYLYKFCSRNDYNRRGDNTDGEQSNYL